ncbi:TIGR01777 family oxidoreductase [Rhodococcus sp. IEGM 1379]|uniref:TIGR01777 family oxidoreductase n=1 Tax=Rhodococcus sp. IEGM 1379 TaxID=3047086 RepID=UPI0024B83B4F|nr:TIGR01777 family oxidoreductase [Rhodococcus sp. IEGM 1379]MDI9916712.1 TIGR01777 family oxidoreductase [Rhodococcus sp. IEGM 1379]
MRVVIAGSSGLIGTALVSSLRSDNHDVVRLVRRPTTGPDESRWDPNRDRLDTSVLRGADAVVNLCGVGIGDKRWSGSYKQEIRDSRISTTDFLAEAVASARIPVLANASAVGYYGDTGDRIVDEESPAGTDFLATTCRDWELATEPALKSGTRVVNLRSGVVMSPHGGMLSRLRRIYSLGLGGRLGNGRQYMPWISLEDECDAIKFALTHPTLSGPVNLTGPAPVTNAQFNGAMSRIMHRPAPWIVPGFALEALIGEFAKNGILGGQRAIPSALENAGFTFHHNTIDEALAAAIH